MERKLHVAAACDPEFIYDIQGRRAEHLILFVCERLGRCDDYRIAGVYADRVDVLHVADRDAIACAVAHDFILDFFPAGDRALDKYLPYSRKSESVLKDLSQLNNAVCDAAA